MPMKTLSTRSPWGLAAAAGVLANSLAAGVATAGPGVAEHAILIVDPSSIEAQWAANAYIAARGLPETAVLYMTPDAVDFARFRDENLVALFGTIEGRGIGDRADYVIVAPPSRYRMGAATTVADACSPVNNFGISSGYTMAFYADEVLAGGLSVTRSQPFYRPVGEPRGFDSEVLYIAGNPSTSPLARQSFIGAVLGWTGERGNTIQDVLDMIDESVAADGESPGGSIRPYRFMNTTDSARNVRQPQFAAVIADLNAKGTPATQEDGVLPTGPAAGIMTGWATPDIDGGTFSIRRNGAFADHLTSFAGHFGTEAQTKMSRWIAKGAVGSSGTVEEPCNYTGKFPHARLHYFYDQGATLGEAYLRSIGFMPFQVQFIGDPLARPFAYVPSITRPPIAPQVSGVVEFEPRGFTSKPGAELARFVILANGVTVAEVAAGETVSLDTTQLPDGLNEIRVIGYDDTDLETRGSTTLFADVVNTGRVATIEVGGREALDEEVNVFLEAPGATEIRVVRGGRVLGAVQGESGEVDLFGVNVGPGPVSFWGEASYPDGTIVRTNEIKGLDIEFRSTLPAASPPIAFDHTRRVEPGQTLLVDLPVGHDADPADVTYSITAGPATGAEVLWHDGKAFALVRIDDEPAAIGDLEFEVTTPAGTDRGVVRFELPIVACPPDIDGDGSLTIFDFLAFQNLFDSGDLAADFDGDGSLTIFDFLAFQNAFDAGC
ncbi:MAG: TIGR03790 family protein [Planctomycetota bacterium]